MIFCKTNGDKRFKFRHEMSQTYNICECYGAFQHVKCGLIIV